MDLTPGLSTDKVKGTDDEEVIHSLFDWHDAPSTDAPTVQRLARGMAERAIGNAVGGPRSTDSIQQGSSYEQRLTAASAALDTLLDAMSGVVHPGEL